MPPGVILWSRWSDQSDRYPVGQKHERSGSVLINSTVLPFWDELKSTSDDEISMFFPRKVDKSSAFRQLWNGMEWKEDSTAK